MKTSRLYLKITNQSLYQLHSRSFGKYAKGAAGKENTMGSNFNFPRHKELFNQDYYDGDPGENDQAGTDYIESPFSEQMRAQQPLSQFDAKEYGADSQGLDVQGGILNNYRKVTGHTVEDMLEGDYWRANKDVKMKAAKMFNHCLKEEQDIMSATKNYTLRTRLNRELDFTDDFRKKYITNDYGNYKKYTNDKNKITTEYDDGVMNRSKDKFYENYIKLIKDMPTLEAQNMEEYRREDLKEILEDDRESSKTFADRYMEHEEIQNKSHNELLQMEEDQDFLDDPEHHVRAYWGRLSPAVKERIYREYLKGATVKDLTLKYGIMQQRVKAVVHQKHLYWEEVYPRLGETHMRLALETEASYAAAYPFVEYGLDLGVMAELEKGVKISHISTIEWDSDPAKHFDKPELMEHEKKLMALRTRSLDQIPLEFSGQGYFRGYLLYERAAHKGKHSPRVSKAFMEVARHYGTPKQEQMIRKKHLIKMKAGGIRFASVHDKHSS